jgi:hypothetical protein
MSSALCRWFVHPEIHLQRATYAELVSSGRLLLIRDQRLRAQLAAEDAAHREAQRLDLLIPAVQRAADPIDAYRRWYIDSDGQSDSVAQDVESRGPANDARCRFDVEGMRRDPRVSSALAQLYRYQVIYERFRQREIAAVEATRAKLLKD